MGCKLLGALKYANVRDDSTALHLHVFATKDLFDYKQIHLNFRFEFAKKLKYLND